MNSKKASLFSLFPAYLPYAFALAGFIVVGICAYFMLHPSLVASITNTEPVIKLATANAKTYSAPPPESLFYPDASEQIPSTPAHDLFNLSAHLEEQNSHWFENIIPYSNDARGPLDFSLHVLGQGSGPTLFVVGGIQGDEPGAFSAASLLVTHYEITKGCLIVVPNLNFKSIILRDRGPNGDMNRKFATLPKTDPEYEVITSIKDLLLLPQVDAILNMHDGSGFYRPDWVDSMRNPKRWGQSVIIDQATVEAGNFGNLEAIGENVLGRTNSCLLAPEHKYYLKNTHTSLGDREMEKTLTYFAITNGKPAFGVEASKNFSLPVRAYYHIQVLEAFMNHMGIEFKRKFDPTPEGLALALGSDLEVYFPGSQMTMLLDDLRSEINYFPVKKGEKLHFQTKSPLITVVPDPKNKKNYTIYYGNRPVSRIEPDYMEFDTGLERVEVEVDGILKTVGWGEVVHAAGQLMVKSIPGYRINAIGAQVGRGISECGYPLKRHDFENRYSIDKTSSLFRVEVYKQNGAGKPDSFAGMFLVRYPVNTAQSNVPLLPGIDGKDTMLGY